MLKCFLNAHIYTWEGWHYNDENPQEKHVMRNVFHDNEPASPTGVATDFAVVEIPEQIVKTEYQATITRQNLVGLSRGFIYDDGTGILKLKSTVTLTYDD